MSLKRELGALKFVGFMWLAAVYSTCAVACCCTAVPFRVVLCGNFSPLDATLCIAGVCSLALQNVTLPAEG